DLALDRARDRDRALDLDRALDRDLALARDLDSAGALDRRKYTDNNKLYVYNTMIVLTQEAFFPDLATSWPPFECDALDGTIGNATLAGPALVVFDREQDERMVRFANPEGRHPEPLIRRGYDLTFPMTAVPLGALRRTCSAWRTDRRYFPLGVAPFLFPEL